MKIYGTGDLHLGQSMNYGSTDDSGYPDKLREQKVMLADFISNAISDKADMVVFAGDYFPKHYRINPDAMRVFSEQVLRLVDAGIPVKILEGNHDKARVEALDSTVRMIAIFKPDGVEVISKPCVQMHDEVNIVYIPHLIPAELSRYQKLASDGVSEAMKNVVNELMLKIDAEKPTILFGHFGIAEAGRGSESTMIAGNNICVSAIIFDRPDLDYCFLGHIHKSWTWKGLYTSISYFGSMDRFDFAEANDRKEYGVITIEDDSVSYDTTCVAARKFVDIKHYMGQSESISFLKQYDVQDAVVKVAVEVDKNFKGGKKIVDEIKSHLLFSGAYHVHAVNLLFKPTFVAKNAKVVETASVEDNLQRVLLDEKFADVDGLYCIHVGLMREIRLEDDIEAEK